MGQAPALKWLAPYTRAYGRSIARKEAQEPGAPERSGLRLRAVLDACGFETQAARDRLWLRNCPFDVLAQAHRPLVCGTTLELVRGVLQGLGLRGASARIEPRPGRCCVTVFGLKPAEAGNVVVEASGRPA